MCKADILNDLIFFEPNRVWRCYTGGKLLDELLYDMKGLDGNFPEEWLASVTPAYNGSCQTSADEGLSKIRGTDILFRDILKTFPEKAMGHGATESLCVLCKLLDSAVRLPVQCHPDRLFASRYCNSEYGKTESWLILDTREINGEHPYILFGFKPGVTETQFSAAVKAQDIHAMTECLHKFPVKPGDGFFIPGRIPHAIGPGILLLEVQEPTDLVVQPEEQIGEVKLNEKQMWGNLDYDTAMSCFKYENIEADEQLKRYTLTPRTIKEHQGAVLETIIDRKHTDCFKVEKLTVSGNFEYKSESPWHLAVVTAGKGTAAHFKSYAIKAGDYFFVSNQIDRIAYCSNGLEPLEIFFINS